MTLTPHRAVRDAEALDIKRALPRRLRYAVLLAGVAMLGLLVRALPAGAAVPEVTITYQTIDYPGAADTEANAVNRTSSRLHPVEVVGSYTDIQGSHGFLLSAGQYTKLDVPGGSGTTALGINARHEIVGTYRDGTTGQICNYKYSQGTYTQILGPCARVGSPDLQVRGINDTGTLVGTTFSTPSAGFIQRPTFSYQTRTVPDAREVEIRGVDDSARPRMVGHYTDSHGRTHGAVWIGDDPKPESYDHPGARRTEFTGVNDWGQLNSGQIVGWYTIGPKELQRGFVRDVEHRDRTLSYPGASHTLASGINNPDIINGSFQVVGTYNRAYPGDTDSLYKHGFIATVSPKGEAAPPFP
jgi:hypothetical protein